MVVLGLSGMQLSQEVISAEGNVTLGYLKQANIVVFSMKAAAEHNLDLVAGKPAVLSSLLHGLALLKRQVNIFCSRKWTSTVK